MSNADILLLSLKNLLRRKTRTILAVVGVVIGICAIIVMLSIGFGMQESFRETVESWGNLHLVNVYKGAGPAPAGGGSREIKLDDKMLLTIEKISGVTAVTPRETAYLTFASGKYVTSVSVVGIKPEVLEKFRYKLEDGRFLHPGDKFTVLFGNSVPGQFYNPKKTYWAGESGQILVNVLSDKMIATADYEYGRPQRGGSNDASQKIEYKEYKINGVGLLENTGDYETDYTAYMPIEVVKTINEDSARAEKRRYDRNAGYNQVMVYVEDIDRVKAVSEAIRALGLQTSSLNDALDTMQEQAKTIQTVLGGIGAVSLLVAALGIANTMIMSIYERTKEIGVMKVIGASLPDIRKLFLTEAAIIGFVGGLLGVAISYLAATLMNGILSAFIAQMLNMSANSISVIPPWLPLSAVAFATFIGVGSGYYPARRAMKLSALEGLRNE